MPKFMKDKAVELLDGGIEAYTLGLYGLSIPNIKRPHRQETRYAPVMGLLGAAVELIIKACLVQAKGISAMYKKGDSTRQIYKFGNDCIDEFKSCIKQEDETISFVWKDQDDHSTQKEQILYYLSKFHLLQDMRANGLHAGAGCSRDVAIVTANEIYEFFMVLAQGKRLKAYLKGIPAPEPTIRDREVIIEDLSRRFNSKKDYEAQLSVLRDMYLVMPYIPKEEPAWIERFDKVKVAPPNKEDLHYLIRTLEEAHSIFLLKNRGKKEGLPVRIDANNPDALPIDVQYIKRTLSTIPDQFHNDVLTANTRLEQGRLDLPIDDFLIDLFALGLEHAKVLNPGVHLTAQQAWPFIVSAYSTQGTPRPCWQFVKECDELDKLISFLNRAKKIGNGHYNRRADALIQLVSKYKTGDYVIKISSKDNVIQEAIDNAKRYFGRKNYYSFSPTYIKKLTLTEEVNTIIQNYLSEKINAGDALEQVLQTKTITKDTRSVAVTLMNHCLSYESRNGLVAVLRSDGMKSYYSQARKKMMFMDYYYSGLNFLEEE